MGYDRSPFRFWFSRGRRAPRGPWREDRWSQIKKWLKKSVSAVTKRLWPFSGPRWNHPPVAAADLKRHGRWRWLRIAYWRACVKLLLQRCFGANYGRATAVATLLLGCVGGLTLVAAVVYGVRYGVNSRIHALRAEYQQRIDAGDYEAAQIAIVQLLGHAPRSVVYRYQHALLEGQRNHLPEARSLMNDLVTTDNYPPAALWLLQQEFNLQTVASWQASERDRFQQLAHLALQHSERQPQLEAMSRMATYLLGTGATTEALRYLTQVAREQPAAALTAANVHLQLGQIAEAQNFAQLARGHFEQRLTTEPTDINLRLNLARTLIIQGHEDAALRCLSEGFELTQDPMLRSASAEAMVIWSQRMANEPEQNEQTLVRRLQLLHRASQCAPQDPQVNAALVRLVLECKDNQHEEVAKLRRAAAQGIDPESLHFARGTLALLEGRPADAQIHLNQAIEHGTQLPVTLNNMAMAIYHQPEGDLEHALAIIDGALQQLPDHPYLHDTRGRILLKMGRYQGAIASLEKGLSAPELQSSIYAHLATAYRQLGDDSLADDMEQMLARVPTDP